MARMAFCLIAIAVAAIVGCSSGFEKESDPGKVVVNMFRAMEKGDTATLVHYLDFESLLKPGEHDYALQMDTPRVFSNPQEIITDLLKGGLTHTRWVAMQRIVGSSTVSNDTALVEVSFINKSTSTQYYTKFGLRKVNDRWKIFSFNARKK
jgi:hypothetical protein